MLTIISTWNPFGILDYTENRSSQIAVKLLSSSYPKKANKDYIVILLQDDLRNDEDKEQIEWPVPTNIHARLLSKISTLKPKIIFSDINYTRTARIECFISDNCKGHLSRAFNRINRREIPFYVAHGDSVPDADWFNEQPTLPTNWNVENNSMPLLSSGDNVDFPLLTLYKIWCDSAKSSFENKKSCPNFENQDTVKKLRHDLLIRWGQHKTIPESNSFIFDFKERTKALGFGFSENINPELELSIPWISASSILWPNETIAQKLPSLIANRAVFIGLDIKGLGDRIFNPINGYVPAVFAHAMGFDNLVQFGEHYWRDSNIELTPSHFANKFIEQLPTIVSIFIAFTAFKAFQFVEEGSLLKGRYRKNSYVAFATLICIPITAILVKPLLNSHSSAWLCYLIVMFLIFSMAVSLVWFAAKSTTVYLKAKLTKQSHSFDIKQILANSSFLVLCLYSGLLLMGVIWWALIAHFHYPSYNTVAIAVSIAWFFLSSMLEIIIPNR